MKVLFVLSQIEVTGAETYALALASALRELGHEIILVSEKLRETNKFVFHSLPLHSRNTSYLGRIQNSFSLKKIIEREKIEIIHSHSRAANLASYFARWSFASKRIPLVVTVHGRWRNHFAARWLPCLGEKTIAVCPYLERYLAEDLGVPPRQIELIPNSIDTEFFVTRSYQKSSSTEMLYVGRLSGQKGKALRFFLDSVFSKLVKRVPRVSLKIIGGNWIVPEFCERIKHLNISAGSEVAKVIKPETSLLNLYQTASLVVGSGRVALEAMACAKPVIAIGESSAPGLLTPENFERAFDSNFGDCGEWNLFEQNNNLLADLEKIITNKALGESLSFWGRNLILERFDSKKTALQVEELYRELLT